jgi:RNA polymerase sigma factor for flagellar operon FliA
MELCREPNDEEVAAEVNMDLKSYHAAQLEANCSVMSLDSALDSEDREQSVSLQELLTDQNAEDPEEALEECELLQRLTVVLRRLPQRSQLLLSLYYYEGLTMKEIGEILELSESRVSQIRAGAIDCLRAGLEAEQAAPLNPPKLQFPQSAPVPVFAAG